MEQLKSPTGQQERRKSGLQKALEEAGWKWLTNKAVDNDYMIKKPEQISEIDSQIACNYAGEYREVLVTEAHDVNGRTIPQDQVEQFMLEVENFSHKYRQIGCLPLANNLCTS